MSEFKYTTKLKHKAIIDLTSLIDLIFLLVAFFMVTSTLGSESSITVNLPRAVKASEYKRGTLVVSVRDNNEIFIKDKKVKKKELLQRLKALKGKNTGPVIIRGDKKADYDIIIYVMDNLNRAGMPKFSLSTIK